MKISKINQLLISISVIAIFFDVARLDIWGTTNLLYLVFNLFLAWIPYIISRYFIKKDTPVKYFIPLFILWLLFFPNAPYLVTDVLHIITVSPTLLWYDSLLFFFFGWIGLLLGILSLFHIHTYLKARLGYVFSEICIFGICLISSFGIYLGRFERWNSWDAFINPVKLLRHSFTISSHLIQMGTPFLFVIMFTVFLYSVYKTMYILLTHTFTERV